MMAAPARPDKGRAAPREPPDDWQRISEAQNDFRQKEKAPADTSAGLVLPKRRLEPTFLLGGDDWIPRTSPMDRWRIDGSLRRWGATEVCFC